MSVELDTILQRMSRATAHCYDLNGDGRLTLEEQSTFFQLANTTLGQTSQIHSSYDRVDEHLANNQVERERLSGVWETANTHLEAFKRSVTSPKYRAAVSSVSFANLTTSAILSMIPGF